MRITEHSHIIFAEDFWDCECAKNYVHRKEYVPVCPVCHFDHTECPDSRLMEIMAYFPELLTEEERVYALCHIAGTDNFLEAISGEWGK